MYTRCPQCKTVHPLNASLLSRARGLVQCGACGRSFSALSFLFDDWPSGEAHRPTTEGDAVLPILGRPGSADKVADAPLVDVDEKEPLEPQTSQRFWIAATALLAILTIVNIAWTFREPILNTPVGNWVKQAGWAQHDEEGLLKDPKQIQLISRDMHTHPTRSGILVLSLTFVNLAQSSQAFPELEITLMDAANQPVAQRQFHPGEYLRAGADTESGLAADVFLPVLLELGDPGDRAVGFEIRFL